MKKEPILTHEQIIEITLVLAKAGDVKRLENLMTRIRGFDYNDTHCDAFIDTMLGNDYAHAGFHVLGGTVLNDWISDNIETVIACRPNIFAWWVNNQTPQEVVETLGSALLLSTVENKLALLLGQSKTKPEMHLHHQLLGDPTLWGELSPEWVGSADSELREAAKNLGFKPSALIGMARQFFPVTNPEAWIEAVDYPYSLGVVTAWVSMRAPENLPEGMEKKRVSKAIFSTVCSQQANPDDVFLAKCILNQINPDYGLVRHLDAEEATPEEKAKLAHIVGMYAGLDALDALMHSLANSQAPGVAVPQDNAVELSALDFTAR